MSPGSKVMTGSELLMGSAGWPNMLLSSHRLGASRCLRVYHRRVLAHLEHLLARGRREQVHHAGDDAGPPGLMARPQARPIVAVEVLVEEDQVPPVRVLLELCRTTINRTPAVLSLQEHVRQP